MKIKPSIISKSRRTSLIVLSALLVIGSGLGVLTSTGQQADDPFKFSVRQPSVLPVDIDENALATVNSDAQIVQAQRLFDVFAWRAFVALNWPARPDGQPDTTKTLADRTTRKVWEYWKPTGEVFLPDGKKPGPWSQGAQADDAVTHWKAAWRQTTDPLIDQSLQAFSGPLIDQQGNWIHYQAFINQRMFDYLVTNELYNLEGQERFTSKNIIEFPINDAQSSGVIEIKLAWKVLTSADDESRYLVRNLPIRRYIPQAATPVATNPQPSPGNAKADSTEEQKTGIAAGSTTPATKVGLVGMHIAMRTHSSPQWIWATLEHIDNTRIDLSTVPAGHPPIRPSLSNPDDSERLVLANTLPPRNAAPDSHTGAFTDWDESIPMDPVEVVRLLNPQPVTAPVNREAQALLKQNNSVLQYYELIGTQWPRDPKLPAMTGGQGSAPESITRKVPGRMAPTYLVNTTMETYFQKGIQDAGPLEDDARSPVSIDTTKVFASESCAGCHFSAGACIGFRKDARGNYLKGPNGKKIPIFGKNASNGASGGANFSWTLQIEAQSTGAGLKP